MADTGIIRVGDRVEVIDDIGRQHECHLGVVTNVQRRRMAVMDDVDVRLTNGVNLRFFDFQLRTPPAIAASSTFDSRTSPSEGMRGSADKYHLRFEAEDLQLHVRVNENAVRGQLTSSRRFTEKPLLVLLLDNAPFRTTTINDAGEFEFEGSIAGDVIIEVFLPGRRVVAKG